MNDIEQPVVTGRRLHACGTCIVFGVDGFRFEGGTFGYFPTIDAGAQSLNAIEFVPLETFVPPPDLTAIRHPLA